MASVFSVYVASFPVHGPHVITCTFEDIMAAPTNGDNVAVPNIKLYKTAFAIGYD